MIFRLLTYRPKLCTKAHAAAHTAAKGSYQRYSVSIDTGMQLDRQAGTQAGRQAGRSLEGFYLILAQFQVDREASHATVRVQHTWAIRFRSVKSYFMVTPLQCLGTTVEFGTDEQLG